MVSMVFCGSGSLSVSTAPMPAGTGCHSTTPPAASIARSVAVAISGPMPSPRIRDTAVTGAPSESAPVKPVDGQTLATRSALARSFGHLRVGDRGRVDQHLVILDLDPVGDEAVVRRALVDAA